MTTLSGHPFSLNALAFNAYDHFVSVVTRQTSTGVSYDTLSYTPKNTPGFDYSQFFTHADAATGPVVLTFSFDASVAQMRNRFLAAGAPDHTVDLTTPRSLNAAEQANALAALQEIESFANIDFQQVFGAAGDINYFQDPRFGGDGFSRSFNTTAWSLGGAYTLDNMVGMVVIGTDNDPFYYRHELGHALTLKHVGPFQFPTDTPLLPAQFLDSKYSIMYYDVTHANLSDPGERVNHHFQLFDVYALQQRFGANMAWKTGDDVYTAASFDGDRQTLWDAGGVDTLDFSAQSKNQIIDLRDGAFSTLGGFFPPTDNLSIAFGVVIENATGGSGNDLVRGNQAANTLTGNNGDDTLRGEDGNDRLFAGLGNDRADGGFGDDLVRTSNGRDTALGGDGNDTLGAGSGGDLLNGKAGADLLLASNGNDRLYGGDDNDTMLGGGGRDTLTGGAGNDRLVGGTHNDRFNFTPGSGADLIVDFEGGAGPGDVIGLIGFGPAIDTFAELMAVSMQVGNNVVINLGGGDAITLQGVMLANLNADDFAFG